MDEGVDSVEEELIELEEEVDLQTPAVRRFDHERRPIDRYSPPDLQLETLQCRSFAVLSLGLSLL